MKAHLKVVVLLVSLAVLVTVLPASAQGKLEGALAEREGFEPSVRLPLHTLSKRAPSTTRTPLQTLAAAAAHKAGHDCMMHSSERQAQIAFLDD